MKRLPAALLACGWLAALPAGAAPAQPADGRVTLVCEAVYLPARSIWERRVDIAFDDHRVRSLQVDGLAVHSFSIAGTRLLTALDNERIEIDTAAPSWRSDFRGKAQSQGRCERAR